jgi:hypothetical protein
LLCLIYQKLLIFLLQNTTFFNQIIDFILLLKLIFLGFLGGFLSSMNTDHRQLISRWQTICINSKVPRCLRRLKLLLKSRKLQSLVWNMLSYALITILSLNNFLLLLSELKNTYFTWWIDVVDRKIILLVVSAALLFWPWNVLVVYWLGQNIFVCLIRIECILLNCWNWCDTHIVFWTLLPCVAICFTLDLVTNCLLVEWSIQNHLDFFIVIWILACVICK